jgi:hypothetical protein
MNIITLMLKFFIQKNKLPFHKYTEKDLKKCKRHCDILATITVEYRKITIKMQSHQQRNKDNIDCCKLEDSHRDIQKVHPNCSRMELQSYCNQRKETRIHRQKESSDSAKSVTFCEKLESQQRQAPRELWP